MNTRKRFFFYIKNERIWSDTIKWKNCYDATINNDTGPDRGAQNSLKTDRNGAIKHRKGKSKKYNNNESIKRELCKLLALNLRHIGLYFLKCRVLQDGASSNDIINGSMWILCEWEKIRWVAIINGL